MGLTFRVASLLLNGEALCRPILMLQREAIIIFSYSHVKPVQLPNRAFPVPFWLDWCSIGRQLKVVLQLIVSIEARFDAK